MLISTFSNIDKRKDSFIHENISSFIEKKTTLNHGKNYAAFLLNVEKELESGYSGSPIYDDDTAHVIGIVNIRDGIDNAYAIDIQEVKELIDDLEVTVFKDIPKKEFREPIARVIFEHQGDDNYKLRVNQTELFESDSIDIFTNQEEIIDKIYNYCCTLPSGEKRDNEIQLVELVMPHQLFSKDIALWENTEGATLFEECGSGVLIRTIDKVNQSNFKKEASRELWDKHIHKLNCFEEVSCGIGDRFIKNSKILSYYLEHSSCEETPFKKIVSNASIFLWINKCDNIQKYETFLSDIKSQTLEEFPKIFRDNVMKSSYACSMNANLMWDNPNTLPKADYE